MSKEIYDVWGRSHYHEKRGQVLKWCPSDSEELFQQHLSQISRKALLEKNGWIDREIIYTFNEHGYRSDSFDLPCEVLFAGCSQTMGIGLPLDVLWSSRVAEHLGVPYHSVACGGADWQHNAQRLFYWMPRLKPRMLILKDPPTHRFNWWDQETVTSTCQFDQEELMSCKINESRPLIDIIESNNSVWYLYSMSRLIEQRCRDLGVILIRIPEGRLNCRANYGIDLARDLMHFGKEEQDYIVDYAMYKIRNEKYF